MKKFKNGQVGLLIVVVVGVLVALIMSVASGTLSDLVMSRQEKESGVAFHVAEQGVEEALNLIRTDADLGSNGSYKGQVSFGSLTGHYTINQNSGSDLYLKEGEVVEINLTDYPSDWLNVFWVKKNKPNEDVNCQGEGSGKAPAALEVIRINKDGSWQRSYFNSSNCDLSANNGFQQAQSASGDFISKIVLTGLTQVNKLRLRPIYNGTTLALNGSALPPQIYVIHSAAAGGDVEREIEVKRSGDQAGSIFDFAVFSAGTIVK